MAPTTEGSGALSAGASPSPPPPGSPDGGGEPRVRGSAATTLHRYLRYGVFAVFILMIVAFSLAEPEAFPTWDTAKSLLVNNAILAVVAVGLTVVLTLGEFDLSFGPVAAMAGAVAVWLMTSHDMGTGAAVVLGIVAGAGFGVLNGLLVAYGRVPALIGTLAVAGIATGFERALLKDQTVNEGIPNSFISITNKEIVGIPSPIVIAVVVVIVFSILMSYTVFGRRAYAVGGGPEAARIAGVRTNRVRLIGFVLVGACAGLGGIMLMSQAASYYPNSGTPLLLPAYTACFLGWSASINRSFHPLLTFFGVLFTGVLTTGLITMEAAPYVTDLVQGCVLAGAVLLARSADKST